MSTTLSASSRCSSVGRAEDCSDEFDIIPQVSGSNPGDETGPFFALCRKLIGIGLNIVAELGHIHLAMIIMHHDLFATSRFGHDVDKV